MLEVRSHIDVWMPKIKGADTRKPATKHGQGARPHCSTLIQILPCSQLWLAWQPCKGNHSNAEKFPNQRKFGKTMARTMPHKAKTLQKEIRKQFGSSGTSRFLRALPGFQVEQNIPDRFADLLTELDRAESDRGHRSRRGAGG